VNQGQIVAVLGANGAGKSTLLNAICGLLPVTQGEIQYKGESMCQHHAFEIVLKGISQSPEGRKVFATLTVEENLNLLLLDEPSLGLAPILVKQIFDIIRGINQLGVSILLVEQNAKRALALATRGYVLETGLISTSGSAAELRSDKKIQEAYLGGAAIKRR